MLRAGCISIRGACAKGGHNGRQHQTSNGGLRRHGRETRKAGGATANYGNTAASLDFPNGLVMQPTVMSAHPERGLIFEYAAMGVPVINLLDARGLAIRNGLPVDPIPLPRPGEGGVYFTQAHSRPAAAAALLASASAVLTAAGALRRGRRGAHGGCSTPQTPSDFTG